MKTFLCGVMMMALALCGSPAFAKELRFVGTTFPLLSYVDEQGQVRGIGPDIARKVAAEMGYTASIRLMPWKRAQAMIKAGTADILIAPYKTPERSQYMTFTSNSLYTDQTVLFVRKNDPFRWKGDYNALKGKSIAVILGWSYGQAFDKAIPRLKTVSAPDVSAGLRMLASGRVDILASNIRGAVGAMPESGTTGKVVHITPVLDKAPCYFGFSKKNPAMNAVAKTFDRKLGEMIKRGEVRKIQKQYGL